MILSLHQTRTTASHNTHPATKYPSNTGQQRHHLHHSLSPPKLSTVPHYIRFKTDYFKKLHYLRHLGLVSSDSRTTDAPSHESLDQIMVLIDHFKSVGFSDSEIAKLASYSPQLFKSGIAPDDISPAFNFLRYELGSSLEETRSLVLRCPDLLFSSVEHKLRPTLSFLRSIGVEKLNIPNNLNAHLLNTQVSKLEEKLEFLKSVVGFTHDEAAKTCARMRALFGYSVDNGMRPKFEYLVGEMERSVSELKGFPQYFGFSLYKRIIPRHMHLKQISVRVSLRDMLVYGDDKFYAKWK